MVIAYGMSGKMLMLGSSSGMEEARVEHYKSCERRSHLLSLKRRGARVGAVFLFSCFPCSCFFFISCFFFFISFFVSFLFFVSLFLVSLFISISIFLFPFSFFFLF
jgi:hypothetical protein